MRRNVRGIFIYSVASALLLIASPIHAQWVLIDNFQNLAAGTLVEGTTGSGATWTGNMAATNSAQVDPDCPSNMAMQIPGESNSSVLRAAFNDASTNIVAGATGTLFYRFRTPVAANGTTAHELGLTDDPLIVNFFFKSGLRYLTRSGVNDMDIRDGGTFETVAALADNTWYSFWMVTTNTNPGTFECYMQSDTDPNFATQTLLVSDGDVFDYRNNADSDIINVLFRNANNLGGVAGNSLFIDDIYINPSASDLTLPFTPLILGDVNRDSAVDFSDIPPFIAVLKAGSFQAEADCNKSGAVDFSDIPPFIDILSGQ